MRIYIMGYSHGTSMIQTPISWRLMGLYVWEYYEWYHNVNNDMGLWYTISNIWDLIFWWGFSRYHWYHGIYWWGLAPRFGFDIGLFGLTGLTICSIRLSTWGLDGEDWWWGSAVQHQIVDVKMVISMGFLCFFSYVKGHFYGLILGCFWVRNPTWECSHFT